MGRPARRVLMAGRGSVLAACASTLYLESEAGIACIAPPSTPCGPLNVLMPGFVLPASGPAPARCRRTRPLDVPIMPGFVLPAAVDLDRAAWRADETTLAIGGLGTFALSPRVDWTPPRPPVMDTVALCAGLASMQAALAARPLRGEVLPHVLGTFPDCASSRDFQRRALPRPPGDPHARDGGPGSAQGFPHPPEASRAAWRSGGKDPAHALWRPGSRDPAHALWRPGGKDPAYALWRPGGRDPAHALWRPGGRDPAYAPEASAEPGPADVRFARAVPALERWIGDALRDGGAPSPPPAVDLLGAGRGLTPSGDDCLAGVLVALHAFGERDAAASLARAVARHAPRRTSRLSAAHLEAAGGGEAIEPVHEAIRSIAGDTYPGHTPDVLDALERFGHGSGFDALAGVLLAARAVAACKSDTAAPARQGKGRYERHAGLPGDSRKGFT